MNYLLFEKSAIELLINESELQSTEFVLANKFIDFIQGKANEFALRGVIVKKEKDGIIACGSKMEKIFLVIDLTQCKLLEKANDAELLIVLQKCFRFAVRFWNHQAFTTCEKIFKDKTVIFPFPFSAGSAYRIVIQRNVDLPKLKKRGITQGLLAYKYGKEGASASADENPNTEMFVKAGKAFCAAIPFFGRRFNEEKERLQMKQQTEGKPFDWIEVEKMKGKTNFRYLSYDMQIKNLTTSQKKIIEIENMDSPIRVEGPAGSGKTAALILRAVNLLKRAVSKDEVFFAVFFTHSKSTESMIKMQLEEFVDNKYLNGNEKQRLQIFTLQEFCADFISINATQIIDLDAAEAKQYQLLLIQDAYANIFNKTYNTYKNLMSKEAKEFFESENENKIILMLQHEFSTRIKGMAEGEWDKYKLMTTLRHGIPLSGEDDKAFVYRVFKEYQQSLESQSVYDTDDIILEALARLNAPLWRRARVKDGMDYLFVDEMHLFNLNEQQVFHFLTKDIVQKIPICFALDYAQLIGDRGDMNENYIENSLAVGQVMRQEFATVFRSSQKIAELCASITASGALLFHGFVNPYKYCESGFTAKEEETCSIPSMIMYDNDVKMMNSLENHIKTLTKKHKCGANEIALVFFDEEMLMEHFTEKVGKYPVNFINGREHKKPNKIERNAVVCSLPEYVNGLEFKCVVLIGVDEGRVPQTGMCNISESFMKYSALNKLYLVCSRAQYEVIILGTTLHGVSSCLKHSLSKKVLIQRTPKV